MTHAVPATRPAGRGWMWVTAGCLAALIGWQGSLIATHWIDPDEGAHLMDARLAAQGLVPGVDFSARQPLYVYTYLPVFHWLGDNYHSGRVMPLVETLLVGLVLWVLARRLWGRAAAHAAALFFLCAPSIVINSTVVKTEPLAMLLASLGCLGLVVHLQERWWWPLVLAGVAFGLGYYVRESTLAGMVAAGAVCVGQLRREGFGRLAARLAALGAGYALVVALVLGAYAQVLPIGELVTQKNLFPLARIAASLGHIAGWLSPAGAGPAEARSPHSDQHWSSTMEHLSDALNLNLHLFIGLAVAAALWLISRRRQPEAASRGGGPDFSWGLLIAFAWAGSMALLYGYYVIYRGFFQSYIREFVPPLALASGWATAQLVHDLEWQRHAARLTALVLAGCAALALIRLELPGSAMLAALAVIAIAGWAILRPAPAPYLAGWAVLAALFALVVWSPMLGGPRPSLQAVFPLAGLVMAPGLAGRKPRVVSRTTSARFVAVAALAGGLALTTVRAGRMLNPAYDCDWSPETVAEASRAIAAVSAPDDEVLSGGMIWPLEARRRTFLNITHPLAFTGGMPREVAQRIARRLETDPPRVIVFDHYAEWTYDQVPSFEPLVARGYRLVWAHADPRRPVRVYVRAR